MLRTYICQSCDGTIVVGHPVALFRRQARSLARHTYSWLQRVLRRGKILDRFRAAMEERFYLEPHRYRALPGACPRCGYRSQGDVPWWRPGLVYGD